jgi:hypothetical protein
MSGNVTLPNSKGVSTRRRHREREQLLTCLCPPQPHLASHPPCLAGRRVAERAGSSRHPEPAVKNQGRKTLSLLFLFPFRAERSKVGGYETCGCETRQAAADGAQHACSGASSYFRLFLCGGGVVLCRIYCRAMSWTPALRVSVWGRRREVARLRGYAVSLMKVVT